MKDDFLVNLLTKGGNTRAPDSKLVSVLIGEGLDSTGSSEALESGNAAKDGPTMMEMMMAEHQQATNRKALSEDIEIKKTTKNFGTGFKKGFFAENCAKKSSKGIGKKVIGSVDEKAAYLSWMQKKGTIDIDSSASPPLISADHSNSTASAEGNIKIQAIPTIEKRCAGLKNITGSSSATESRPGASINADVQKAMNEDEPPMLKQLREGDWVTPDLLEIFQKNEVIKSGLKNAKCTAAMQMMQKDPKEASKRFQGDPEVDDFLREFGRVMSGHFEKLGNKKDVANSTNGIAKNDRTKCDGKMVKPMISESGSTAGSNSESKSRIIEIDRNLGGTKSAKSSAVPGTGSSSPYGILQSEALERHRQGKATDAFGETGPCPSSTDVCTDRNKNTRGLDGLTDEERDTERVKKVAARYIIVTDEELSSLLLDIEFQQILKDCSDPIKYHTHMRNPNTAKKIHKMFQAGLVATVK